MPGFNGTGPRGMGQMTGGGRGFCAGGKAVNALPIHSFRGGMGGGYRYQGTYLPSSQSSQGDLLSSLGNEIKSLKEKVEVLVSSSKEVTSDK